MPSSVIKQFEYFADKEVLRVTYLSGNIYDYKGVPEKVYKEIKIAGSKGRYLNKRIKGVYDFEQVDTEETTTT